MLLKRVVLSTFAAAVLAQAQPYKIFVETFDNENNPAVNRVYAKVVEALEDRDSLRVVKRQSGKYFVVVVEGIADKSEINSIYAKIKSLPGHRDAFLKPAPELLEDKEAFKSTQTVVEEDMVEDVIVDDVPKVPTARIKENVRRVDTKAAMVSRSENPNRRMTLDQTISLILEKNPIIQKSIFDYMETGKDLDISQRGYYPTLDLTASIGIGQDRVNGSNDSDWKTSNTKQAELRLVQKVYDGGVTSSSKDQEMARVKNAAYLLLQNADRTTLATVSAYLNVLQEKALLDLSAENIIALENIYDRISERAEKGYGRLSQKQQAASRLTLAQSNFIAQQNAYDDSLIVFQRLTGVLVDANQLSYPQVNFPLPQNIKIVERKAMMCNPAVKAEEANVELAEAVLEGAGSNFLPKLNLEAFVNIQDRDNYAYDKQRIDSYGALLRLNYNLYNGGKDSVTKEKRKVTIQKEEEILRSIKDELRESLRFSWQSYVLNSRKLGYVNDHAKFSKQTLEAYKEEFKIGRRDLISVLDAENEYYTAKKEIVKVERDILYAKYRLLDNMGVLTDSFKRGFGQSYVKGACSLESN